MCGERTEFSDSNQNFILESLKQVKNNNNIISSKEISIVSTVGLISIFFIGSVFDVSGVSLVPRRDHHKLLVLSLIHI